MRGEKSEMEQVYTSISKPGFATHKSHDGWWWKVNGLHNPICVDFSINKVLLGLALNKGNEPSCRLVYVIDKLIVNLAGIKAKFRVCLFVANWESRWCVHKDSESCLEIQAVIVKNSRIVFSSRVPISFGHVFDALNVKKLRRVIRRTCDTE